MPALRYICLQSNLKALHISGYGWRWSVWIFVVPWRVWWFEALLVFFGAYGRCNFLVSSLVVDRIAARFEWISFRLVVAHGPTPNQVSTDFSLTLSYSLLSSVIKISLLKFGFCKFFFVLLPLILHGRWWRLNRWNLQKRALQVLSGEVPVISIPIRC